MKLIEAIGETEAKLTIDIFWKVLAEFVVAVFFFFWLFWFGFFLSHIC